MLHIQERRVRTEGAGQTLRGESKLRENVSTAAADKGSRFSRDRQGSRTHNGPKVPLQGNC